MKEFVFQKITPEHWQVIQALRNRGVPQRVIFCIREVDEASEQARRQQKEEMRRFGAYFGAYVDSEIGVGPVITMNMMIRDNREFDFINVRAREYKGYLSTCEQLNAALESDLVISIKADPRKFPCLDEPWSQAEAELLFTCIVRCKLQLGHPNDQPVGTAVEVLPSEAVAVALKLRILHLYADDLLYVPMVELLLTSAEFRAEAVRWYLSTNYSHNALVAVEELVSKIATYQFGSSFHLRAEQVVSRSSNYN